MTSKHGVRQRPARPQHRGGADRHRERHGVAEPIGEEQLGGRKHDVVGADAEHALSHQPRRRHQAGMDVPDAFRVAGRAGRVEPERDLVGDGRRSERRRLLAREQVLEAMHVEHPGTAPRRRRLRPQTIVRRRGARSRTARIVPRERRRDHERGSAAVAPACRRIARRQERVERDDHDPGADRAPEGDRKVDRVVQQRARRGLPARCPSARSARREMAACAPAARHR